MIDKQYVINGYNDCNCYMGLLNDNDKWYQINEYKDWDRYTVSKSMEKIDLMIWMVKWKAMIDS